MPCDSFLIKAFILLILNVKRVERVEIHWKRSEGSEMQVNPF